MKKRAAAIIIQDGMVLLIRRIKPGRDYYTLPGGGVKLDETFAEACSREVKEETGLDVLDQQVMLKYVNAGYEECYFIVTTVQGTPVLGYPESEHQSPENQYIFEWANAQRLENVNLRPPAARRICLEALHR